MSELPRDKIHFGKLTSLPCDHSNRRK